jgi:phosphatidylinositol alpha-mannosyltransferase
VLLRAFASLPDHLELELAGVEPSDLAAQADGLSRRVLARVNAHGRVSDERRRELLARADVLCAPSLGGESFGLVVVEGMAASLPVVASDIPGYREVLPASAGRLVRPGDDSALAAAVAELLGDDELRSRLGDAGLAAAQRYDWSVVADEVVAVYAEAMAR